MATSTSNIRHQKKNQTARQAMMISGLQTIYRNNSATNAIQKNIRSETKIYFLDITIEDINNMYAKINQIIETGRLKPKGTELYFVKKHREHLLITEGGIYEIKTRTNRAGNNRAGNNRAGNNHNGNNRNGNNYDTCESNTYLQKKSVIDGLHTTKELITSIIGQDGRSEQLIIPIVVDESYFQTESSSDIEHYIHHIPSEHSYIIQVKKIIRFHNNAPNAFVFIFDESEKHILDFYMTTENGILQNSEKLNNSFKDDMISFLLQFKLY